MLYLVGHLVFRLRMAGSMSSKRLTAVVGVGVCGVLGIFLPALLVAALMTVVLVVLIVAEALATRRWRAAHPS
jgi:low temperature requirement protein LtrA